MGLHRSKQTSNKFKRPRVAVRIWGTGGESFRERGDVNTSRWDADAVGRVVLEAISTRFREGGWTADDAAAPPTSKGEEGPDTRKPGRGLGKPGGSGVVGGGTPAAW